MIVKKKQGKIVEAYKLGDKGPVIEKLMTEGLIIERRDGIFEVFSQEAVNGSGEEATKEHYIKVDSSGKPYPISPKFFCENHRKIKGDSYEQIPKELHAWTVEEEMCDEIRFLDKNDKIVFDEKNEDKYFNACLWGSNLSSPKDSVVVFYGVEKNGKGEIIDIDFNFVKREEFEKTYDIIK